MDALSVRVSPSVFEMCTHGYRGIDRANDLEPWIGRSGAFLFGCGLKRFE